MNRLEEIKDKNGKYTIEDDGPRRIGLGAIKETLNGLRRYPEEDYEDDGPYPDCDESPSYDDDGDY